MRRTRGHEQGFALILVMITSLLVGVMGIGIFSVVMSDLHGAVANQLAMQTVNIAEAGIHHAISQMYTRALATPPTDASYRGETGAIGAGTFQVVVLCEDGSDPGSTPPECPGDNDVRLIISTAALGARPARRRIEIRVRRFSGDSDSANLFCGRLGVNLHQGTTVAADIASNRDIIIEGPRRNPGTVQAKDSDNAAPPDPATFTPIAIPQTAINLTGAFSWKVTFVDQTGIESTASPSTASVPLTNENGYLSAIPIGGATIVKRRIYRTRADQAATGPWFFVGEIPDNTTTTYRDMAGDALLIHLPPSTSTLPAPTTAPAGTPDSSPPPPPPGLTGSYTYKVTFVYRYPGSTTAEIESVASTPAMPNPTPLTLTNEYVKLTNIPQTTDPNLLKRRIYRSRGDAPGGPWLLLAEIASSNNDLDDLDPDAVVVERGYVDKTTDTDLTYSEPRAIAGNAYAGDDVDCSQGCPTQVDGEVRENVREVLCAPWIPPPCNPDPDNDAPMVIRHTDSDPLEMTLRYDEMHPGAGQRITIETPNNPLAELHIHLSSVTFERDAILAISGRGRVYFHVAGAFHLGQRSWFGLNDNLPGNLLVWPGDRIGILSCAIDASLATSSVHWDQQNRVAALVVAPRANILINQAGEFTGALVGQYIEINQGLGYVLDPGSGLGNLDLRTAFQMIDRWYDNPRF